MTLTAKQQEAFDDICDSIEHGRDHVLVGYAGTGKTYLTSKLREEYPDIISTAPTNKAVKVQHEMGVSNALTIYKLLCLRLEKRKLVRYSEPNLRDKPAVLIDECSMINREIFGMIQDVIMPQCPVIFVGDPFQLPPVKEDDSLSFSLSSKSILTDIVRQKEGNPIIEMSLAIRENGFDINNLNTDDTYITSMPAYGGDITPVARQVYEEGGITAAWTNKVVNMINQNVHNSIYGANSDEFVVGERIVLDEPWLERGTCEILANNGDQFTVAEINRTKLEGFDAWEIWVEEMPSSPLTTIASWDKYEFQQHISYLFKTGRSTGDWSLYQVAGELLDSKTDIKHTYASTCHKLQGSTYTKVLIHANDINRSANIVSHEFRDRCMYVAVTRAAEKICLMV